MVAVSLSHLPLSGSLVSSQCAMQQDLTADTPHVSTILVNGLPKRMPNCCNAHSQIVHSKVLGVKQSNIHFQLIRALEGS
jgi:hypothetical protein